MEALLGAANMFAIVRRYANKDPNVPLASLRQPQKSELICVGCLKGSVPLFRCTRCKVAHYCSKECQRIDWTGKNRNTTSLLAICHKEACPALVKHLQEFQTSENGVSLRQKFLWADQHNSEGSFYMSEFLARKGLFGQFGSFWDVPDPMMAGLEGGPYNLPQVFPKKDRYGFQHGSMLLKASFPSLKQGWHKLKKNEYPLKKSSLNPLPDEGLKSWMDYMAFRDLPYSSVAPLLLTHVLTIYNMLHHELNLREGEVYVSLLGVEKELNFIPLFGELAFLLPKVDLTLRMFSPSVIALYKEAQSSDEHKDSIIMNATDGVVFDFSPESGGHVRVKLDLQDQFCHTTSTYTRIPDAMIALNAGLSNYQSWNKTVFLAIRYHIPFCFSDHSKAQQLSLEKVWFPGTFQYLMKEIDGIPKVRISLNPFHGIVNRDTGAMPVPSMENGALMTWDGQSFL